MQIGIESLPRTSVEAESVRRETYRTRDWNENVLHVYPRTFNEERPRDEKHHGLGSILGITEKLDWIKESGITAIWLGPIYESPGLDGNYDISDYYKVNSELGTMDDVKKLINAAHDRDIRVIFDLVPNHTSDQSEWFKASRDPDHPDHEMYRDYYIWRDPVEGELPERIVGGDRLEGLPNGLTVPNNWSSIFSLPQIDIVREQYDGEIPEGVDIPAMTAWTWDEQRQQFYLAEFMKEQPTLNWENLAVREEVKSVVRFWLDLGVDSFRVDVMNHIGKDTEFRNEEPAPVGPELGMYNLGVTNPHDQWKQERLVSHWPELGEYVADLLSVLDEEQYEDRNIRLVLEDWMSALGDDTRLDMLRPDKATVFNFETLLNTNRSSWVAGNMGRLIRKYYEHIESLPGAVPNQVTGNHDTDTIRTRLGSAATARAAHFMLAALPGALYTWQGDMFGRPNMIVPQDMQQDGDIGKRDGERVPMQWNASKNGGFSRAELGKLWLPSVDSDVYRSDNIEVQTRDPNSPYRLVTEVLIRRLSDAALRKGSIRMLHTDHEDVLAFARNDPENPRRQVISVTNFSQDTVAASILDAQQRSGRVTLSSLGKDRTDMEVNLEWPVVLLPDESYFVDSSW
ncbi:MAG: alpha amylase, alpha-glucosidase [Candidatus Saccharibacteria bacterium]|nr:alpha amylase, alpha-glucosidase [Candidatus Saccharibacteria bacterium]